MTDEEKNEEQLMRELAEARQQIDELIAALGRDGQVAERSQVW